MAIFGNSAGGRITINGKAWRDPSPTCCGGKNWNNMKIEGNKAKADCSRCGTEHEWTTD